MHLTANGLKWIAIITMIIDHIGAVLYPVSQYPDMAFLRIIGRIAFPIFAFLIVEGYRHTGNLKAYAVRLFLFALISEVPFDLAFYGKVMYLGHQNVFFTLVLGLWSLHLYDRIASRNRLMATLTVYIIGVLAMIFNTDYGIFGIIMIFGMHTARTERGKYLWIAAVNAIMTLLIIGSGGGIRQIYALLSIVFISRYNAQKGKGLKYIFYLIYPVHLFILHLVDRAVS